MNLCVHLSGFQITVTVLNLESELVCENIENRELIKAQISTSGNAAVYFSPTLILIVQSCTLRKESFGKSLNVVLLIQLFR